MNTADVIGWIGNIFFIYGVYALGIKRVHGFHCNTIGNIMYAIQGIMMQLPSLVALSLILIGLNVKGIIEWTKKKKKS